MKKLWLLLGLSVSGVWAAEVIPPKPAHYFNDYAQVVSCQTVQGLDRTLEGFEGATSSQIVVAVFPKMQSDSSIEDYTVRVAQAWGVGQKGKNSGAVLFVFVQDHKIYLQVGYGLEGALPDALAKRIIENEIKPHFKRSDFDGGLRAGVNAILQATRGEYQGTGKTLAEKDQATSAIVGIALFVLFFAFLIFAAIKRSQIGTSYTRNGRIVHQTSWGGWPIIWGSGDSSGGGWSGGAGFSGGGGSFGGGGAGGSW